MYVIVRVRSNTKYRTIMMMTMITSQGKNNKISEITSSDEHAGAAYNAYYK